MKDTAAKGTLRAGNGRRLMRGVCLFAFSLFAVFNSLPAQTRGLDVSKFQGNINWTKVAKDKTVKFVYIKATEGTSIQDPYYKTNVAKAKKAGLLVGSYHLYSSKTTAYQQFANFKKMVKKSEQDLIPVLDIEGHHVHRLDMKRVDKLLELMEKEYGVKPMIYTSEKLYKVLLSGKKYSKYHIFIANYRSYPKVPFTLWQYTETGHISGVNGYVDISKINRNHSLSEIKMPKKKKSAASSTAQAPAVAATGGTATTPPSADSSAR